MGLLCLSLLCLGLFWLLYHGSGHNIPAETDRFFAVAALVNTELLGLIGTWIWRGKRAEKQRK